LLVSINAVLNNAYKKEKDSNVKERILVKRVKIDKQEAASVAEHELNRSRWLGAYKWLHRFDKIKMDWMD
jgi:hypothetical protein